jgi:uncharacterized protein YecE (DUF72 family)
MGRIFIGTSGWAYGSWKGCFYPPMLPDKQRLSFYADRFPTTEVNYSYYHVPTEQSFRTWAALVPPQFVFTLKANRIVTHLARLNDVEPSWSGFVRNATLLGTHLGPILVQLPPTFLADHRRLSRFLTVTFELPSAVRLAFEFRHLSWFTSETYRLLTQFGAALCIADSATRPRHNIVTAGFTYLRYHGRTPREAPFYTDKELHEEAAFIERLANDGIDAYVYFNNDADGHAPTNAARLNELLGQERCVA